MGRSGDDQFEDADKGRPRKPAPRRRDEDDEDDRPRRRRDADDEDDDYPRRGPRNASRNGMALFGYYMGFLSIIFSLGGFALLLIIPFLSPDLYFRQPWIPTLILFGMIFGLGGLCAIMGIIFSSIGLARAKNYPVHPGRGHAIVGLVLSILTLFGLIAILVCGAAAIGGRGRF